MVQAEETLKLWNQLVENLLNFVFPAHVANPSSGARLFAYALYGPAELDTFDPKSSLSSTQLKKSQDKTVMRNTTGSLKLRGGMNNGNRLMLDYEMAALLRQTADDFITEAYLPKKGNKVKLLTDEEIEQIKRGAKSEVMLALQYTVREVEEICAAVKQVAIAPVAAERDATLKAKEREAKERSAAEANTTNNENSNNNTTNSVVVQSPTSASPKPSMADLALPPLGSGKNITQSNAATKPSTGRQLQREKQRLFTLLSKKIMADRHRRSTACRSAIASPSTVRTDPSVTRFKQEMVFTQFAVKPYTIQSWYTPKDVQRSLHRNAHLVSHISTKGADAGDVVQNVKVVRVEEPEKCLRKLPDGHTVAWDPYCCVRNAGLSRPIQKGKL
eukprot:TRINITY_DN66923_c6_g1_i1.p1 TRINITY_DN66923_c6_g1~~TRINITY_DN66923_c6_g1_i1.p1  ORF type:complete len:388 (+),score=41.00 TRINITY_DN66923_c6_g1_i1:87-1250(+)